MPQLKLIRAQPDHSQQLTQFFANQALPGHMQIQIHRNQNFFNKYKVLSDDYVTLMLIDEEKEIQATASVIFTPSIIEGKEQVIGIATDLRLNKKRRTLIAWMDNFLPLLIEEREKRNCKYIFSPIAQGRVESFKAFIRPRTVRRNFPRYHLFRRFDVVSIHGLYPWGLSPINSINIGFGTAADVDALQNYLKVMYSKRPLHFPKRFNDLEGFIKQWPGMSMDNFLIAKDTAGNIIGCINLWDGHNVENIEVTKKSKRVMTFEQTLKALSLFGTTHKLISGKKSLLNMLQINFLNADNPDIFYSLLRKAWKLTPKTHFLTYVKFENQLSYTPPRSFITNSIPYNMYCLLAPNDPYPEFLHPSFQEQPPDLDMAFI